MAFIEFNEFNEFSIEHGLDFGKPLPETVDTSSPVDKETPTADEVATEKININAI